MRVRFEFSSRRTGRARAENSNQHRVAFPKLAKDVIRISDIVLEILDARFIAQTRNKEMEELVKKDGKVLITILNKSDLINVQELMKDYNLEDLKPYVFFSCKSSLGRNTLRKMIKIIVKKNKFAQMHKKAHVGVIGYPNTGKSSIINMFAGGGKAGTSAQAGFTRGIQRIRFNRDILILDTPGVFHDKENTNIRSQDLVKQAEIGVKTYDSVKNPDFIVHKIMQENKGVLESFYNIEAGGDAEVLLNTLGKQKGFMRKGQEADTDKTARYVLKDWQEGKIRSKQKRI